MPCRNFHNGFQSCAQRLVGSVLAVVIFEAVVAALQLISLLPFFLLYLFVPVAVSNVKFMITYVD